MGLTKSEKFSEEQNTIAQLAKVLGHPARIAILQHLSKVEDCICGEIVTVVGLAQPTISQHLRELKKVKLIKGNIEGTSICYCIDSENWRKAQALFSSFFESIHSTTCK